METQVLTTIDTAGIGRLQQRGLFAAVAGLAVGAVGVFLNPAQLAPSLLIGFWFCIGLSLGCFALLMLQHMTGGQWGLVSRRIYEAGARLLPYCIVLFIPVAVLAPKLYLWAQPDVVAGDHILQMKAPYLNVTGFIVRAVIYFAVWLFCIWNLDRWSVAQDRGELAIDEADTRRFRVISAPGILVYVILVSLASVDWAMSLDPHWYSTIYGLIQVVGQGLSALAFGVAVLAMLSPREPMNHVLRASHFHDLGKLMLALVMLYAYFSFSQFLIIWAGNLPEEIPYYLERLHNGWQPVTILLVVGHFFLPFCVLLSRDLKRRPNLLARVAWFIVGIRLLTDIWLIAPTFNQSGTPISVANIGIPVGLAGVWVWLFAQQLGKRPLLPINDPYFKDMLLHGHEGGHDMSSHPHPHGELVNENVHHEEHDINIRAIVTFVVVLTVVCVGIEVSMVGFFKLLNLIETKSEPVVSPLTVPAATDGKEFPLPSLQLTPWADLKKLRAEEAAHMHSYGWVDQSAGIGRIPIDRAKALLLEKGLPVRPDVADPSLGTHVAATGESAGGRNLPGGQADKSSAPTASAPTAPVSPAASQPAPKGPGGAL